MVDSAQGASKASETILQQAASDFLSSYSEFLNAASLLERRPQSKAIHPDTNRSLAASRWLLARAISELGRVLAVTPAAQENLVAAESRASPTLPSIVARAIGDKILTQWPEAERLLVALPAIHSASDVIPVLQRELSVCEEAVSHVDVHSSALSWQLHTALSAFTDALVKGQYIAIAKLEAR
jgi:hypothetical protein